MKHTSSSLPYSENTTEQLILTHFLLVLPYGHILKHYSVFMLPEASKSSKRYNYLKYSLYLTKY